VHKTNSEIVKSRIMMLSEREKTDVPDADVDVDWMQAAIELVVEREKKTDVTWSRERKCNPLI
jgi:hypothetical protein